MAMNVPKDSVCYGKTNDSVLVLCMPYTVYCKSFEVEKFRGFRGLTGDRETIPVKDFPTGNFF